MAKKKPGLHKGLDVLLEDLGINMEDKTTKEVASKPSKKITEKTKKVITAKPKAAVEDKEPTTGMQELSVNKLSPGRYQPRRDIIEEELEPLVASIKSQGILQPIVVRTDNNDRFEIIAGERRFRAAKLAGLAKVPVIVKDVTDEVAMAIGLVENIQREDLNPLEEAYGIQRLVHEFKLTHEQIAKALGKSRTAITNLLRLLGLHEGVRLMLERGDIELGHAKVLLALKGVVQLQVAKEVVQKSLTVRATESLVTQHLSGKATKKTVKKSLDPDIKRLQTKLSDTVGASVKILHSQSGKRGRIVIKYSSLDELDGILAHIN